MSPRVDPLAENDPPSDAPTFSESEKIPGAAFPRYNYAVTGLRIRRDRVRFYVGRIKNSDSGVSGKLSFREPPRRLLYLRTATYSNLPSRDGSVGGFAFTWSPVHYFLLYYRTRSSRFFALVFPIHLGGRAATRS